ncbi:hypothetical protein ACS0TY_008746 [Phlomoides rotata]
MYDELFSNPLISNYSIQMEPKVTCSNLEITPSTDVTSTIYTTTTIATAYSQRHHPLLTTTYYNKSCPKFEQIISSPTTVVGTLRLFFHDCFVEGYDASTLVSSTRFSKAKRDADINLYIPGDGFDVVVCTKSTLGLTCPGVVSCTDILVVATRNLVVMIGGPYYAVKLGWKDSFTSVAFLMEGNLPRPRMLMNQIIQIFQSKGFSIEELFVADNHWVYNFGDFRCFWKKLEVIVFLDRVNLILEEMERFWNKFDLTCQKLLLIFV